MFRRLFTDHPAQVGESYGEHFRIAAGFGVRMIIGGLGAIVHAFVPGWCKTSGSDTVRALNAQVIKNRTEVRDAQSIEWNI